jgi:beta-glucosidase
VDTLPPDFFHGYSTAAYQCEGGWDADGKGPSVWDDLGHNPRPPLYTMRNDEVGDDAMNSYHQFREDIALLKSCGSNAYRFSISWPRVIPLGGLEDPINEKGLQFYSDLVDECLASGITPFPTLYHWDLPLALEQKYEGWSDTKQIVADFVRYADVLFARLGDRVKYWLTINEVGAVYAAQ